jgi:hypothetical protein
MTLARPGVAVPLRALAAPEVLPAATAALEAVAPGAPRAAAVAPEVAAPGAPRAARARREAVDLAAVPAVAVLAVGVPPAAVPAPPVQAVPVPAQAQLEQGPLAAAKTHSSGAPGNSAPGQRAGRPASRPVAAPRATADPLKPARAIGLLAAAGQAAGPPSRGMAVRPAGARIERSRLGGAMALRIRISGRRGKASPERPDQAQKAAVVAIDPVGRARPGSRQSAGPEVQHLGSHEPTMATEVLEREVMTARAAGSRQHRGTTAARRRGTEAKAQAQLRRAAAVTAPRERRVTRRVAKVSVRHDRGMTATAGPGRETRATADLGRATRATAAPGRGTAATADLGRRLAARATASLAHAMGTGPIGRTPAVEMARAAPGVRKAAQATADLGRKAMGESLATSGRGTGVAVTGGLAGKIVGMSAIAGHARRATALIPPAAG